MFTDSLKPVRSYDQPPGLRSSLEEEVAGLRSEVEERDRRDQESLRREADIIANLARRAVQVRATHDIPRSITRGEVKHRTSLIGY